MLERMLESHSQILGGPEPHLLTPLAHLGVWDKVNKAPYDHILAAESQKSFVDRLPGKEEDYWRACRAYCDELYGQLMKSSDKTICLDKTPAYALVLPFIAKVFPDAKYVVLTRHPLATFSSFANSFFDGDFQEAQNYNPLLNRYVPAIARFLRQSDVSFIHVPYEELVGDPEGWMKKIYNYIGVEFEVKTIDYGGQTSEAEGLGDPIGVNQYERPTTASLSKWVDELRGDVEKRVLMEDVVGQLEPADLESLGYPLESLWLPLEEAGGRPAARKKPGLSRYRIQRMAIMRLRKLARGRGMFRKFLEKVRLAADVLLRD